MENLQIEPNKLKTPEVNFDAQTGVLELSGMSSCENSLEFYAPIINWLEEYTDYANRPPKTVVNIKFKYFNTSSAKCIIDVLERLANLIYDGENVEINWYYEKNDEEMYDAGENFADLLEIDFNMKQL